MKTITGPYPDITVRSDPRRAVLNQLVGQALLDPDFCHRLLDGSRSQILQQHAGNLPGDERAFLMSVRADTLKDFAQALANQYPYDDGGLKEPPSSHLFDT